MFSAFQKNVHSLRIKENAKSIRNSCFMLTYQFQLCFFMVKYLKFS